MMDSRQKGSRMPRVLIRVGSIFLLAFLLFLIWDFSQRVGMNIRLRQSEQDLGTRVAQAEATQAALLDERSQVQSDTFVEDYVRRHWRWAREGETLVIFEPTPKPPSSALPAAPATPSPWWQGVFDFLFGP